jgi:UrcA family protein
MKYLSIVGTPVVFRAAVAGTIATSILFADPALSADDHDVTVAIHVDAQGLNLSNEGDVRKFYQRIKNAAWIACTRANRTGLSPVDNPAKCADASVANAIRSASMPALTELYLETHTLQQAAALGIDVGMVAGRK